MGASQANLRIDARQRLHKANQRQEGYSTTISSLPQGSNQSVRFSRHDDSQEALECIGRNLQEKDHHLSKCRLKGAIKFMSIPKNLKELKGKLSLPLNRQRRFSSRSKLSEESIDGSKGQPAHQLDKIDEIIDLSMSSCPSSLCSVSFEEGNSHEA